MKRLNTKAIISKLNVEFEIATKLNENGKREWDNYSNRLVYETIIETLETLGFSWCRYDDGKHNVWRAE